MGSSHNAKQLLGEAGEHLVISRLQSLGYVASQAPRGWRADDVFVREGPTFQVKATNKGLKTGWMVGHITPDDNRWYALVDFRNVAPKGAQPFYEATVYVLPSAIASEAAETAPDGYVALHPNVRDDPNRRKLRDPWDKGLHPVPFDNGWLQEWRERWEQLPRPADA